MRRVFVRDKTNSGTEKWDRDEECAENAYPSQGLVQDVEDTRAYNKCATALFRGKRGTSCDLFVIFLFAPFYCTSGESAARGVNTMTEDVIFGWRMVDDTDRWKKKLDRV